VQPQGRRLADDAGADLGPGRGPDDQGGDAARQVAAVLDAGDGAHPGVAAVLEAGEEHEGVAGALGRVGGGTGLVGLERQRHDHVRQHDVVVQRQDRQGEGVEISHRGVGSSLTRDFD
jgi:hypothetical protein